MDTSTYATTFIINSGKFNTVKDLLISYDDIVEMMKEDIYRINMAKGHYYADAEANFYAAKKELRKALKKNKYKRSKKTSCLQ